MVIDELLEADHPARLTEAAGRPLASKEHLLEGGHAGIEDVEKAKREGVTQYVPAREREPGPDVNPVTGVRTGESAKVAPWRARMCVEEATAIESERGKTSETIGAAARIPGLETVVGWEK